MGCLQFFSTSSLLPLPTSATGFILGAISQKEKLHHFLGVAGDMERLRITRPTLLRRVGWWVRLTHWLRDSPSAPSTQLFRVHHLNLFINNNISNNKWSHRVWGWLPNGSRWLYQSQGIYSVHLLNPCWTFQVSAAPSHSEVLFVYSWFSNPIHQGSVKGSVSP